VRERGHLPQADVVEEDLVPVDAHALGVDAVHRATLFGRAGEPAQPQRALSDDDP
jgi:hypothetical protein